jgi:hypothetical protein
MREGLAGARFQEQIILAPGQCAFAHAATKLFRVDIFTFQNLIILTACGRATIAGRPQPQVAIRAGTMTGGNRKRCQGRLGAVVL